MDGIEDREERWPVAHSSDLHRDGWVVALREDRVSRPGAEHEEEFRRVVLEHPGAAVVLAVDDERRVCLLRQYRHPVQRRLVELPAGLLDRTGEDPLDVARRELREEAGLEAGAWQHLGATYTSPGISAELVHLFWATDLSPAAAEGFEPVHEEADMEVFWAPWEDLLAAVLAGRTSDGPLVQAVLHAAVRGLLPHTPPTE